MIVLINLNDYLGGGETLLLRIADFLHNENFLFKVLCLENSYIQKALIDKGLVSNMVIVPRNLESYYYLDKDGREKLKAFIIKKDCSSKSINYVTFCLRDLYAICDGSKDLRITHLALHYQDNLYLCQSLLDKFLKLFFNKNYFSRKNYIEFNKIIINRLCESSAVIPMSLLMVDFWNKKFNINLKKDNVVALPTYDFENTKPYINKNQYKIIWIGRIVDFKIPALCAMLNFIDKNKKYSITIVGNGDLKKILKYIEKNKIDSSRIKFIGQVDYSDLGGIIKNHSIGYAVGTSIIEICKYGLPCIMGLSTPKHRLFNKNICGGIFAGTVLGNVGDNLFVEEDENSQPIIEDVMLDLELNYQEYSLKCYEFIKADFAFTKNMKKYLSIIKNSSPSNFEDIEIPLPSFARRFFLKFYK